MSTLSARPPVREPQGIASPSDVRELERVADVLARTLAAAWMRRQDAPRPDAVKPAA
jgi:hypothetical protein